MYTKDNDLEGKVFGDYTVISHNPEKTIQRRATMWNCKCNRCGDEIIKQGSLLLNGLTTICRKCHTVPNPKVVEQYKGKMFGSLEVLDANLEETEKQRVTVFNCKCHNCGNIIIVKLKDLNAGKKSCGCDISSTHSKMSETIGKTFGDIFVESVDEEATKLHGSEVYYWGICNNGHRCSYRGYEIRNNTNCPMCSRQAKDYAKRHGMLPDGRKIISPIIYFNNED